MARQTVIELSLVQVFCRVFLTGITQENPVGFLGITLVSEPWPPYKSMCSTTWRLYFL